MQERHLTEKDLIDNPDLKLQLMAEASNIVKDQRKNGESANNKSNTINYATNSSNNKPDAPKPLTLNAENRVRRYSNSTNTINLDNKPTANSRKLQNFIDSLYKGQGNPNQIGNGTTMDSIRYELKTGNPVEGKFHSQKGQEFINGINKLINSGSLDAHDEAIARALVTDITNALNGK